MPPSAPRLLSRPFVALAIASAAFTGIACQDITTPSPRPLKPDMTGSTLPPAITSVDTAVVADTNLRGWIFVDQAGALTPASRARPFVVGPDTVPIGAGSAELAHGDSAGAAIALNAHFGTRLSRITALRYSSYRQTEDLEQMAAPSLDLNVDPDAADAYMSESVNFVYEPYQGEFAAQEPSGGIDEQFPDVFLIAPPVGQNFWQHWNPRNGLWSSASTTVRVGGVLIANPCGPTQACSWSQLLARFPNAALRAGTAGVGTSAATAAIVLNASKQSGFRGNVDMLTIGIDAHATIHDFEPTAGPATFTLATHVGVRVLTPAWAAESTYRAGAVVHYSFAARPGHRPPSVILDDTLAAASGQFVMDRDHVLLVDSDTIYTYAGLQPTEKSIADLMVKLMTASDKVWAQTELLTFTARALDNGASSETIADAVKVAGHVVMHPVRDSASLRAIDEALGGYVFYLKQGPNGVYVTASKQLPARVQTVVDTALSLRDALGGGSLALLPAGGGASRDFRQSPTPEPTMWPIGTFKDPWYPPEETVILYTNGIFNLDAAAYVTQSLLGSIARRQPALAGSNTVIARFYNRTASVQRSQYLAAHPCEAGAQADLSMLGPATVYEKYEACIFARLGHTISSLDAVEVITMSIEKLLNLPNSNEDVDDLAKLVAGYRRSDANVILVGHSQGTAIGGLATKALPGLEGHPVQVANSCVAAIALASPFNPSWYELEAPYVGGFMAEHDIARLYPASGGWSTVRTTLTDDAGQALALSSGLTRLWLRLRLGHMIHSVNRTYLGDTTNARKVGERLASLHSECVVGDIDLVVNAKSVENGENFTTRVNVWNKNNNRLFGRTVSQGFTGSEQLDSVTFRAVLPYHDGGGTAYVKAFQSSKPLSMPRVKRSNPGLKGDFRDSGWHVIEEANGVPVEAWYPQVPTTKWDGSFDCSKARIRVDGPHGAYVIYGIDCWTQWTPASPPPSTIPSGVAVLPLYYFTMRDLKGGFEYVQEGAAVECPQGVCEAVDIWVDQYSNDYYEPVASSLAQTDLATFSRLADQPPLRHEVPVITATHGERMMRARRGAPPRPSADGRAGVTHAEPRR